MSDDLAKQLRTDAEAYRQSLALPDTNDMCSLAYQWQDKKHRHVYDLCRRLETAAARIEKLEEENTELQSKVSTVRLAAKYAAKIRDDRIEKLKAALRDVLLWGDHCQHCDYDDDWAKIEVRARKALEGKDE